MNRALAVLAAILLAGCNAMGGVPREALENAKDSAAYCIRVESLVMGKAVVTAANATPANRIAGNITVNPETCAITITNAPAKP